MGQDMLGRLVAVRSQGDVVACDMARVRRIFPFPQECGGVQMAVAPWRRADNPHAHMGELLENFQRAPFICIGIFDTAHSGRLDQG